MRPLWKTVPVKFVVDVFMHLFMSVDLVFLEVDLQKYHRLCLSSDFCCISFKASLHPPGFWTTKSPECIKKQLLVLEC